MPELRLSVRQRELLPQQVTAQRVAEAVRVDALQRGCPGFGKLTEQNNGAVSGMPSMARSISHGDRCVSANESIATIRRFAFLPRRTVIRFAPKST